MQQKNHHSKKNIDKQKYLLQLQLLPKSSFTNSFTICQSINQKRRVKPIYSSIYIRNPKISTRYHQQISEQEDAQDQTTTAHDPLAHQRKTGEIIDNSIAQSGTGIKDEFKGTIRVEENESYDSKRDRWYGYSTEEWLTHLKNWNDKKQSRKHASAQDNDDSDDTDYELN